MTLPVFLNELSVPTEDISYNEAKSIFLRFIRLVRVVRNQLPDIIFYAHIPIRDLVIGTQHSIASLRNDIDCREESQFLKRLQDRAPFNLSVKELGGPDLNTIQYFHCDGLGSLREAQGLGLAHVFDGLGLSFDLDACWRTSVIELELHTLTEASEIESSNVSVRNLSSVAELADHADWLASLTFEDIEDGTVLWMKREELFPNLLFIGRVRPQLEALKRGTPLFYQVVARLREIDRAVGAWDPTSQAAPAYTCHVRPESQSRISEGLFNFKDDNGITRTFSNHVYVAPPPHRIHFITEARPAKMAIIGHVGRKLGIG